MDKKHEAIPGEKPAEQNSTSLGGMPTAQDNDGKDLSYDRDLDKIEGNMNNGETGGLDEIQDKT